MAKFDGVNKLVHVLFEDDGHFDEDGELVSSHTEINLVDGECVARGLYEDEETGELRLIEGSEIVLIDGNGDNWTEIPVTRRF